MTWQGFSGILVLRPRFSSEIKNTCGWTNAEVQDVGSTPSGRDFFSRIWKLRVQLAWEEDETSLSLLQY